jgi:membrane protein
MRLALYVGRRFRADGAFNMASSLSYTSLLSLVPLLAIGLAVLAAFPVFDAVRDDLQATLFRYVVPEVGEQVQRYVAGFVKNAGKLTAAGVVGLAISAVMVLVTIESSFNQIFRVTTPRTPLSRLLVYWTALTLGPLMLGASFSLSAWLFYAASDWAAQAGLWILVRMVTNAAPVALLMAAFGLLYLTVPNRRVGPMDAAIGGIVAGFAFAILRWGFGLYMANAKTYQSIYGAVASVPIFLFWMYLSWMVILFGAELTAALPEWRLSRETLGGPLSARRRLALALSLLAALFAEAKGAGLGCSRVELLDRTGEPEKELLTILKRLCQNGYVVKTEVGRYVLGRDLNGVTLADVVRLLDLGLACDEDDGHIVPLMASIASRLNDVARAEAKALDMPLNGILEAAACERPTASRHAKAVSAEREVKNAG